MMQHNSTPSLFPQLQIKHHKDIVTPNRQNHKVFHIHDKVLVFDKLTKLDSLGVIVGIKSKNSYSVNINGTIKHISGDNMSHTELSDSDSNFSDDDNTLRDSSSDANFSDDDSIFGDNYHPVIVQPDVLKL